MEKENKYKILFFILLIILIFGWLKYNNLREENTTLTDENVTLADQVYAYQDALNQANENIEEANSVIEETQWYAWSSYEEMGDALDNLYTVNTVSEP